MTGLDTFWADNHMWLHSSYTRARVYFRLEVVVFQTCLVVVYIALRSNYTLQAAALFVMFMVAFVSAIVSPPFRLGSSNIVFLVLTAIMLVNSVFGVFNAMKVMLFLLFLSFCICATMIRQC